MNDESDRGLFLSLVESLSFLNFNFSLDDKMLLEDIAMPRSSKLSDKVSPQRFVRVPNGCSILNSNQAEIQLIPKLLMPLVQFLTSRYQIH